MSRSYLIFGVLAVLIGLAFVFPQLANLRMHGNLIGADIVLLCAGLLVTLGGVATVVYGIRGSRAGH